RLKRRVFDPQAQKSTRKRAQRSAESDVAARAAQRVIRIARLVVLDPAAVVNVKSGRRVGAKQVGLRKAHFVRGELFAKLPLEVGLLAAPQEVGIFHFDVAHETVRRAVARAKGGPARLVFGDRQEHVDDQRIVGYQKVGNDRLKIAQLSQL